MNEFFTWTMLATSAGCATATAIITQFVKNLKPLKNIATQWVSFGIAVVLLYLATYFTGGMTPPVAALIPLNAVLIALAANGAYSAITRVNASATVQSADGDIPTGAASGVTVVQEDVTPAESAPVGADQAAEVQQDTALSEFPDIDNVTLEQIDTAIEAANIAISNTTDEAELAKLKLSLSTLKTLRAAKTEKSGAVAPNIANAK
jgi:hypothetical protein